ncbi:DUF1549 domain-containing protein [Blastopirellula marina]|uniref:DUF1549 domain-containing protein n=1 Tax=Blastopirellula marina TaxID=124 RepID=A0A2S8GBE3_9BACT|nr:DUF1549 domain-containing protein [Blastopirellula marina]PQO41778.1 hypothetical protein C5Y98_02980 [Blastopirellula marina]PTL46221.1 DUF1553 domain-containing protein [Blastopirellula marina]
MWLKNLAFIALATMALASLANWLLLPPQVQALDQPVVVRADDFNLARQAIDRQFHDAWSQANLQPTHQADDLAVARRISLGLVGTIPSLEEIRLLEQRPEEDRLQWWVDYLLNDRRYGDYMAERLSRAYVGTENGPFLIFRKRRFVTWLSDQLMANRPYDELTRDLISETGLWTDHPAVNFVTATVDQDGTKEPDVARLAGRLTRAFLATRIDCVQCHDDNLGGDLKQSDFHELASFFREAQNSFVGITDKKGRPYAFRYLYADEEVTVPAQVPFNQDLLEESGGTLRQRLASWVTHRENKPFARAIVNRVWAVMTGRPLVEPVDDIPLEGSFEEGNLPAGMEPLVDDFIAHDFDLKRLIRLIASTEVFHLDSRSEHEITAEHEKLWASFPVSRLRPEQVIGSINQASSLHTLNAESHILTRLVTFGETNDFLKRYGDAGEDEFSLDAGTIPQRLLMMNGNLVKERTKDNFVRNAATKVSQLSPDDQTAIETAFLCVLTRRPTEQENKHFLAKLQNEDLKTRRTQDFEDIYWALMNCTEFAWNH